jgi:kumamolisin
VSEDPSAPRAVVPGSERTAPAGAKASGAPDPSERITVTIVVRPRTGPRAKTREVAVHGAGRRTYPDRAAFAARYGADPADVAAVERFALEAGAIVLEASLARRSILVEGTIAALAAAFEAELSLYLQGKAEFRARTGSLTVPAVLNGIVVGVFGLDARPQARTHFRRVARPAAAADTSYTPPQVAQAYAFPSGLDGTGETIALIELGGGFSQSDLDTFFSGLGIATPSVTSVGVDGATNVPDQDPDGADGEVLLDIEVAGSLAPGAKIVVYFGPNTDQGFLDTVTTAIHDTTNKPQSSRSAGADPSRPGPRRP